MNNLTLCIQNNQTDPYFNLAAEEYILKNFNEDSFMLWRNEPSIIVGKHQNALAEINLEYVREKQIKVVRRLSGGGAVFHDLGNLNFTFIMAGEEGKMVDFKKFTKPIVDVLHNLNIEAKFEGQNDLTIGGLKFSGNSEHIWRNKTLHHGTLLFSAGITDLSEALKANPIKFTDKAVKSIRSRVTNISDHLPVKMDILEFSGLIVEHFRNTKKNTLFYEFNDNDIHKIEKLRDEKYSLWEWNFGYSPKYKFEKLIRTKDGNLEFHLNVEKGLIREIKICGDHLSDSDRKVIEKYLMGTRHDPKDVKKRLEEFESWENLNGLAIDDLINGMF